MLKNQKEEFKQREMRIADANHNIEEMVKENKEVKNNIDEIEKFIKIADKMK
jgi:hypothetical protein